MLANKVSLGKKQVLFVISESRMRLWADVWKQISCSILIWHNICYKK